MRDQTNPPGGPKNTDEHIDDRDAALEESEEDDEEARWLRKPKQTAVRYA